MHKPLYSDAELLVQIVTQIPEFLTEFLPHCRMGPVVRILLDQQIHILQMFLVSLFILSGNRGLVVNMQNFYLMHLYSIPAVHL